MAFTEVCLVHSHKKSGYYITMTKSAKCEGCKACGFGRKNKLVLPALSQIECEVGDRVVVQMPESSVKGSYVYLYLLPLLFIFVGMMIPYGHSELYMFIGAAIGFCVSIPLVYLIERLFRRRAKYLPIIIRKIDKEQGE